VRRLPLKRATLGSIARIRRKEYEPPVLSEGITKESPRPSARITGVVYLLYFLTVVSSALCSRGIIVSGDPAATATNILMHERLFRLSVAVGLIATALYIAVTVLFCGLFKPVDKTVSLLAAFFSLVGCAIQAFGSLFQLAPLAVLEGSPYQSVRRTPMESLLMAAHPDESCSRRRARCESTWGGPADRLCCAGGA